MVPPLLFILPVENAFKHGAAKVVEGAWISLTLTAQKGRVHLRVENGYDPDSQGTPGIGMANLRRRLALLFPGRHRLDVAQDGAVFRFELALEAP